VVAAAGYPGSPVTGAHIEAIDEAERVPGAYVLQAGTATGPAGRLVSSGGRVLNVVGAGATLAQARATAYQAAARITMPGGWYRTDIAAALSSPA